MILIAVSDTGIGIDESQRSRIFEKFQQADLSVSRVYGGTGLGLSITKHLVSMMGGKISLESSVGEGSSFVVTLPYQISEGVLEATETRDVSVFNTYARIMIVDDHPVNLLYMKKVLSEFGMHNLDVIDNGRDAIDQFKVRHHDVVLLDCHMPDISGFDVARRIKQYSKSIEASPKIIAVTADAMKGVQEKIKEAGMDYFISKPIDEKELGRILKECVPDQMFWENDFNAKEIDWNHLGEFSDGNEDFEKQILDMFTASLRTDLKELSKHYEARDFDMWFEIAHKIYGASSHFGAVGLAHICDQTHFHEPQEDGFVKEYHGRILQACNDVLCSLDENRHKKSVG